MDVNNTEEHEPSPMTCSAVQEAASRRLDVGGCDVPGTKPGGVGGGVAANDRPSGVGRRCHRRLRQGEAMGWGNTNMGEAASFKVRRLEAMGEVS